MRRLETPTFAGRHVRLEPLERGHAAALVAAANAARSTYIFTLVPNSVTGMEAYIEAALAERDQGLSLPFVVRDAAGVVVGSTRYMCIEWWTWPADPPAPVPSGPDAIEIGHTWYAERVQRTGLNTEAKLLLCGHAFDRWGVRRITWKTDERNSRSRAAIQRLGAHFDGVLRAHRAGADNTVRSTAFFSMLAAEWPEARQALVRRLEAGGRYG
jgi:RimJ/RimL family protein N-acetyltransferase